MPTSRKTDFRQKNDTSARLKITFVNMTYPGQRPELPSLSRHFLLSYIVFARVDETKANKWKRSANAFEGSVVIEELRLKRKQLAELRLETEEVYKEIRTNCSSLRFLCILKTIVTQRNQQYRQSMNGHIKQISRL